jgi:hypothetical protein
MPQQTTAKRAAESRFELLSVGTGNVRGSYLVIVHEVRVQLHTVELELEDDELVLESRNRREPNAAELFVLCSDHVLEQLDELALDEARALRECMSRYGVTP